MCRANTMPPNSASQPIRLSACLIVKDEEARLPQSLESVAFCDEIVVVDSGSSDRTVEIARAAGARVLEVAWRGFAAQRNVALDAARGEWALEVDADERVSAEARDDILALIESAPDDVDNGMLPLRQIFLGARLGPSALYPACRQRLFRVSRYRHDERRSVHEGLWPLGRSAYLNGELEHILSESMRESFRDLLSYTSLEAEHLPPTVGMRQVVWGAVIRPSVKFVYRTGLLGGWHDGATGITKISLDCLYDSLTWIRHWLDVRGVVAASPTKPVAHFGQTYGYRGPVRIIAVARGRRHAAACAWLQRAQHAGADVALITNVARAGEEDLRTVALHRWGPLAILRALDQETGRNPIEVLVVPTRLGRLALRTLPRHLRGTVESATLARDPRELMAYALDRRADG